MAFGVCGVFVIVCEAFQMPVAYYPTTYRYRGRQTMRRKVGHTITLEFLFHGPGRRQYAAIYIM